MSFDQNMIIDATTGSIARFVNHSCNPNCRMIKWIVSGQPRMALFAGDRPIMTGDELTYDYNFDPFSAKNVQKCLCGEPNCRGVLGPKPREVKPPKAAPKITAKDLANAKRKLKELGLDKHIIGGLDSMDHVLKKRKIQPATSVKRSLSSKGAKVVKGATKVIKKALSTKTKKTKVVAKSPAKQRVLAGNVLKKTTVSKRSVKTYGKTASPKATSGSTASVTVVARGKTSFFTPRRVST